MTRASEDAAGATESSAAGAGGRCILAVDGIDGSGKSRLAQRLTEALTDAGIASVTLAVDDFRRPVDWHAGSRPEADIYYEDYYDLPLLDRSLAAFLSGAPFVDLPVFDVAAHRLDGMRRLPFDGASLAIVEGVFGLRVAAVANAAALVYVRTSFATAHARVLARDTARGRTADDVTHRIAARYFPAQERYIAQCDPLARAEVILDNEDWRAPTLVRFDGEALRTRWRGTAHPDFGARLSKTVSAAFATAAAVG